jgi:acyl-CoA thioesterase I
MRDRFLLASFGEPSALRSCRRRPGALQMAAMPALLLFLCAAAVAQASGDLERRVRMVVLGDSLSAGLGLPINAAFPARLQSALEAKGLAVEVVNAGVSGDTASAGLARLDWSVPDGTDAVIVELGANDMLQGIDPRVTRRALDEIVRRLTRRGIVVLLAGMRAPPNLGAEYGREFESIFPDLAATNNVLEYPFFLDGVAADAKLNQSDGVHPTAAGIEAIVARILPTVEELVARAQHRK